MQRRRTSRPILELEGLVLDPPKGPFVLTARRQRFLLEALLFEGFGPKDGWVMDSVALPEDIPTRENYDGSFLMQFVRAYLWLGRCFVAAVKENVQGFLSAAIIVEVNRLVRGRLDSGYSTHPRYTSFDGKTHHYPYENLEEQLIAICDRLNSWIWQYRRGGLTLEWLLCGVARFVHAFLELHPFPDGNGRTARLIYAYVMESLGLPYPPHVSHPEGWGTRCSVEVAEDPAGMMKWWVRWEWETGQQVEELAEKARLDWCKILVEARMREVGWTRVYDAMCASIARQGRRYWEEVIMGTV